MPAAPPSSDRPIPAPVRGRGFTAETLTGLLAAGVAPRHLRRLLCAHGGEDDWRNAPLLEGEDPGWRHVAPVPHGADHALVWGRPEYPAHLAALSAPPPVLYVAGAVDVLGPAVAIVGSRAMGELGRIVATVAAETAVELGAPVVSGGAQGVDTTAHEVAVANGGRCVAFVPNGLTVASALPAQLRAAIIDGGGAVVSELPPEMAPTASSALARNRLIAASAAPLVVAEAAARSGSTACAGDAVMLSRPIVVPKPRPGHRRLPGAQGLAALAGSGQQGAKRLGWTEAALRRVVHHERIANAVCDTRDDLALAISVFWWLYGTPRTEVSEVSVERPST